MKIVKYVINKLGIPILFNRDALHIDIDSDATSAGFAIIHFDLVSEQFVVKCYGESSTLNKRFNQMDFLIIQQYLNQFC